MSLVTEPLLEDPDVLVERAAALGELGRSEAANELLDAVVAGNSVHVETWTRAASLLMKLGRVDEVPALVDQMLEALPDTGETSIAAAAIARKGRRHELANRLVDHALSHRLTAAETVAAGRLLLQLGRQGRVVTLLRPSWQFEDHKLRGIAGDLRIRALLSLRLAREPGVLRPVHESDRADAIALETILLGNDRVGRVAAPTGQGIAIVLSSLGPGGAQTQTMHFLRALCSSRRRLDGPIVLLLTSPTLPVFEFRTHELAKEGVTIECISRFDVSIRDAVSERIADQLSVFKPTTFARTAFLVDRLRVHRPETVLAMSYAYVDAVLAASVVGVPRLVLSARGNAPEPDSWRDQFLRRPYQIALARRSFSLVTNSARTAQAFEEWLEQPPGAIAPIRNGVDVDGLRSRRDPTTAAAHRRSSNIPENAPIVGSIFGVRTVKRPELWIRAASLVAARALDVAFLIVGTGFDARWKAAKLPSELEGRIFLPGPQRDVPNWLELMDVVLLTSASEGTPNVLLEAQALGKPVVTTDVGGASETFLPGMTGILLARNPTPEEVADGVMRVLGDPAYAIRARDQGPVFIRERFGMDRMVAELAEVCFPGSARAAPPLRAASGGS